MNCIIVDDEPLARKGLKEYVQEINFLHLVGECENANAAEVILKNQKVDLIFLDIEMPRLTGIDFLKSLQQKPIVIFTTAYPQYALQGYELEVLDYLVKPFPFDRFLKACTKAKEFYEIKNSAELNSQKNDTYFFVRSDNQYEKIFYEELLFAEAMENYVILQTINKRFIAYLTFKAVENHLPANSFIKVHKSFIIASSKIDKITGNQVKIGSYSIPISRVLKEEVMNRVVKDKLLKR